MVGAAMVALVAGCVGAASTPQSATSPLAAIESASTSPASIAAASPEAPSPPALVGPDSVPPASAPPSPASLPPSPPSASPPGPLTLATVLAGLPVAAEHRTGYIRTLFRLWIDADGNGCDTRHEVLIAEAIVAPTVGGSCALTGGEWLSLYDGLTFSDARKLDIDHVVPLAEAWDSGAWAWDAARRTAFANDLGVSWALIAVSAASNRSKGDQDPADWLPPRVGFRCEYLADWVAIKERWHLTVDPAEKAAIADQADCQATTVPQ